MSSKLELCLRGLNQPPYSKADMVPRALLRETRSFWRTTTDPMLGETPKQKPATEFNNWLAMAPYALQYCPAATLVPVFSAPVCCTAVSPGAVLSLFSLFYYFSGNSYQCNCAWYTGWKIVSLSPSSFNLMNCLFSYQRVMSTPNHIIFIHGTKDIGMAGVE